MDSLLRLALALLALCAPVRKEGRVIAAHHSLLQRKAILPQGYLAVDWLDTGFTGTANQGAYFVSSNNLSLAENTTRIVSNWVCLRNVGEWNVVYSNQTSDNQSGSLIVRKGGDTIRGIVGDDSIKYTIEYDKPTVAVVDSGSFYVDDVLVGSVTPKTNVLTQPFLVGNILWQASSRRIWPGLIGRISVYSSGTLVADYIPCQEVSTSKHGFFDTVSKVFGASANASYPFIPATI